jgi:hypothetical protein
MAIAYSTAAPPEPKTQLLDQPSLMELTTTAQQSKVKVNQGHMSCLSRSPNAENDEAVHDCTSIEAISLGESTLEILLYKHRKVMNELRLRSPKQVKLLWNSIVRRFEVGAADRRIVDALEWF